MNKIEPLELIKSKREIVTGAAFLKLQKKVNEIIEALDRETGAALYASVTKNKPKSQEAKK